MKWKTLQHNGILFPPKYESLGIKIKINGQNIDLTLDQEEMIYQWAKKKDAPKPGTTEKYIEYFRKILFQILLKPSMENLRV